MADPALKLVPDAAATTGRRLSRLARLDRMQLRVILLGAVPAMAALVGLTLYLMGGRIISTDNAYVGAQKVLITPDIYGKIDKVAVREGAHVAAGDVLFTIDPVPFRLALMQAQAKLAGVRADFAKLKANYASYNKLVEYNRQNVELKQRDVERKKELTQRHTGSQADLDTAAAALVAARLQAQNSEQQRSDTLNQLLDDPALPIEKFPPYIQAKAALDQAERDLRHAVIRAPISGIATQVDNIQLGRFISAGTPMLSVIDDKTPWVEANPKETDITYLRVGQKATLYVDAFPDRTFHGTVVAVSPGTGAQFAILPPQNASGNWIKVVQRVPVRIAFDKGQDTRLLRAGMSVQVEIDTHHRRTLGALFGFGARAPEAQR